MKVKSPNARRLEKAIEASNRIIDRCEQEIVAREETMKGLLKEEDKEVYRKQIEYYQERIASERSDIQRFQEELSNETEIEIGEIFFQEELEKMHGMRKWDVNGMLDEGSHKIPESNGYFGGYTLITYYGKQAVVYVDDRDAEVLFVTPFFDEIYYGRDKGGNNAYWSGDTRWGGYYGVIVVRDGDKYNLITRTSLRTSKLLCDEWYVSMDIIPTFDNELRQEYRNAVRENGEQVRVANGGYIIKDLNEELSAAKAMSREEIFENWVKAGKLVVGGSGWTWKGAGTGVIPTEKAIEMFPKYSFGKGFYEMEWTTYKGQVALSMREYSECDME